MNSEVCGMLYNATRKYNSKWYRKLAMYPMRFSVTSHKLRHSYLNVICKLRLYTRFIDGRCQWCGDRHLKDINRSIPTEGK